MSRHIHGRRAKQAQWLSDAEALSALTRWGGQALIVEAARAIRAQKDAKRERRLMSRQFGRNASACLVGLYDGVSQ